MSSRVQFSSLVVPVLLLGLVAVPPLWLDHAPETDAVVFQKYEGYRLNRDPDGGWRRRLVVWTRFKAANGTGHTSELMLGNGDYDTVSVGSHLRVRYLPVYPYTTRLVTRTTLMQARDIFTPETTRGRWMGLLLLFAPLTFLFGRLTKIAGFAVAGVWLWATWIYILRPVPLPVAGPQHTSARVSWTEVQSRGLGRGRRDRLRMPYRLVALSFVPAGARDSITVLDAVDSASLTPMPANGSLEPIGYEPGLPRTARLLMGSRSFINANRYEFIIVALAPIALALIASSVRLKRRRPARAAVPASA